LPVLPATAAAPDFRECGCFMGAELTVPVRLPSDPEPIFPSKSPLNPRPLARAHNRSATLPSGLRPTKWRSAVRRGTALIAGDAEYVDWLAPVMRIPAGAA
jgi:hypothetical protein